MKKGWVSELKKIGMLRLLLIGAAVLVLVVCSIPPVSSDRNKSETEIKTTENDPVNEYYEYERILEERLKSILEKMDGISSADVMITIASSAEMVTDKNTASSCEKTEKGKDAAQEQGSVNTESSTMTTDTVMVHNSSGDTVPYVLKKLSPAVRGVLVAVGGNITDAKKYDISEAVQALFDVPAHKVKIVEKNPQAEVSE